jgi:hypothetical protein
VKMFVKTPTRTESIIKCTQHPKIKCSICTIVNRAIREVAAATGSHPVADQACVAVAVAHPVAGPFCTLRTPILYPPSEELSGSQGSACLPFSAHV